MRSPPAGVVVAAVTLRIRVSGDRGSSILRRGCVGGQVMAVVPLVENRSFVTLTVVSVVLKAGTNMSLGFSRTLGPFSTGW